MRTESLDGGLADPARDAAHAFRAALSAMSRPGRVETIRGAHAPAPMSEAAATLILTLCDPDTPLWLAPSLESPAMRGWIAFHTGAPLAARHDAAFAVGTWAEMLPLGDFRIGIPEYPDRSATLIVEVEAFGDAHRLTGPGIGGEARLTLPDPTAFRTNAARFPLGFDTFLTAGDRVAAVPRTTRVEG